jgi:hypothetical protein
MLVLSQYHIFESYKTNIYRAVIIRRLTAQQGQEFNGAKGGAEQLFAKSANRLKHA